MVVVERWKEGTGGERAEGKQFPRRASVREMTVNDSQESRLPASQAALAPPFAQLLVNVTDSRKHCQSRSLAVESVPGAPV